MWRTAISDGSALRRICLAAAVVALATGALAQDGLLDFMHGRWEGGGVSIAIDSRRMLGNADPGKPFQREPLRIRDMADGMVVFFIGERRFVGLFEGDRLVLTGDGVSGTATLSRRRSP